MPWFKKPSRAEQVHAAVLRQADLHMRSRDFKNASKFVQAFSVALVQFVPDHAASLVCLSAPADTVGSKSGAVLDRWRAVDDAHLRDLASLLAWLQSKSAFADADELFPESQLDAAYRTLMTISFDLFPTSDRGMMLCKRYQECLDGDYRTLGGGLLSEGGTYFVSLEAPSVTTHLWMVNEALGGPDLNMISGDLDPASIFYLQITTVKLLTLYTDEYRKQARTYYETWT